MGRGECRPLARVFGLLQSYAWCPGFYRPILPYGNQGFRVFSHLTMVPTCVYPRRVWHKA